MSCSSFCTLDGMVGNSAPMRRLRDQIARVAPTNATVLIHGETGTGKELAARAIHLNSRRSGAPMVALSCAAIPETLLESELFGYSRGAFTGAASDRKGKLELAHEGTLFLDEVGELPIGLQAKLLRAIQEREFTPLGATKPVRVDVRFVAATNVDLLGAVEAKTFRQDLYYRLAVVALRTPTLRERREDIRPLSEYFLQRFSSKLGQTAPSILPEAIESLRSYNWPGNVRELQNSLERATVLGDGQWVRCTDLPETVRRHSEPQPTNRTGFMASVKRYKCRLILDALAQSEGCFIDAARILEIHPNSLHRLVQNLGLRKVFRTSVRPPDYIGQLESVDDTYDHPSVCESNLFSAAL